MRLFGFQIETLYGGEALCGALINLEEVDDLKPDKGKPDAKNDIK